MCFKYLNIFAFCLTASQLAANLQTNFEAPPNPLPAPQHCTIASLPHRYQPYRVPFRGAYPRVERSSHVPPMHPRKDYQLLCWPSSNFTPRVVCNSQTNVFVVLSTNQVQDRQKETAVRSMTEISHRFYCMQYPTGSGHTLGLHPGPPRNRRKPPSQRCGEGRLELRLRCAELLHLLACAGHHFNPLAHRL